MCIAQFLVTLTVRRIRQLLHTVVGRITVHISVNRNMLITWVVWYRTLSPFGIVNRYIPIVFVPRLNFFVGLHTIFSFPSVTVGLKTTLLLPRKSI